MKKPNKGDYWWQVEHEEKYGRKLIVVKD